jgi:hypothetical protein
MYMITHFMYTYAFAYKNKVVENFKCETFQLSTTRLLIVCHMPEQSSHVRVGYNNKSVKNVLYFPKWFTLCTAIR